MEYKKIVVAGGGVLGSQIAFQSAYSGFDVTVLIRPEDDRGEVEKKLSNLVNTYKETINNMNPKDKSTWARGIAKQEDFNKDECLKNVDKAIENIKIETDQKTALEDADLVIESITENLNIKNTFYQEISKVLPEKTVLVTNSSTLLPSKMAKHTGRPNKFLSFHFANSIWKNNITEIMRQNDTEDKYFKEVMEYAEAIHMIPLAVNKEKSGYLLNSLLVPFLLCAMDLLSNGISDPETIDKAWTLGTGAPNGPFQILDTVGLETAKNIVMQYQKVPNLLDPLLKTMMLPYNYDGMLRILNEYIEAGKMGKSTSEGFYKYGDNNKEN